MSFIVNPAGFLNITGIITVAEVNALGSMPYVFTTPAGFTPIGLSVTVLSGSIQPIFTSMLMVITVLNNRVIYLGTDPANFELTTIFGLQEVTTGTNKWVEAINIDLYKPNNFCLQAEDLTDPTPGDYEYRYNLYGFVAS